MAKKIKVSTEKMYISDRLVNKMQTMRKYPLIVVEAPMGYGKTMCMRTFLKKYDALHIWISTMDSSAHYFWNQFCEAFRQIDDEIGMQLMNAGIPSDSVISCTFAHLMSTVSYDRDIFLVIDDYQLIFSDEFNLFFEILARENIPQLHLVLIGRRKFTNNREELIIKNLLMAITETDLKLTDTECRSYFEECGINISASKAKKLYDNTEGWITAVYLSMLSYVETKEIAVPIDLFSLFENSIYKNYTDDQKDFLLRVCIFNKFSREQARFMRRKDDPLRILENIVDSNGFIRYDARWKNYHIHTLFSRFLRDKLSEKDLKFKNEVYRHAADWHYLNGEFFLATLYYYNSRNFEDMLKAFERDKGKSLSGRSGKIMIEAFNACPDKIKNKYPMASMIYAKQLSMLNENETLKTVLSGLESHFNSDNLTEREKTELKGEYYMLLSYLSYNNLEKMTAHQKNAAKYLKKASAIVDCRASWTYGAPSVLYMYYREPGSLDELIENMYASRDLYYRLTDNNGRGGEYILEAEREFMHDRLDKADIMSHKSYTVAKKYNQTGIMICALFLQARIAILRGDTDKGLDSLKIIRELVTDREEYTFVHTADICKAYLYAVYNQLKPIEKWILDGNFSSISLYYHANNFLYVTYGRILLDRKEYSKFLGLADGYIKSAKENHNLIAELYMYIFSSIAYDGMELLDSASMYMQKAVELAIEDQLYMPFVENGRDVFSLVERISLTESDAFFLDDCRIIYKRYEKNLNVLLKEDDSSPLNILTKREQEIALLVADGKTNMEIARELNIAEITVKKSLSNIYARFGISNRTSLIKKINS